jgi:hypothetical protein
MVAGGQENVGKLWELAFWQSANAGISWHLLASITNHSFPTE